MRRTILLADDSPTIQRLVTSTFADGDYEIVSVSNGEAAVRKIEEIHPHVVLADIYMPGKNGYEVCSYVREHDVLSDIPVVLLVGAFDAFDEERARTIGANAHITKPFEPQALITLVESVLPPPESDDLVAEEKTIIVPPAAIPESAPAPALSPAADRREPVHHEDDLLGLESLFPEPVPEPQSAAAAVTEQDIDRIADRVIQRLSAQVIESIAWEIVPDITEKIVREEIKRTNER